MKKYRIEKALVLGLLLSTSVYGVSMAEDIQKNGLWDPENPIATEIQAGDNLIVTTTGVGIGPKGMVNVIDGDLTVDAGSNSIQSGYSENATVQILANNVTLNSGDNGIFTTTESGYTSTVTIGSEERKIQGLTINASGQGIDNKNGDVYIYGTNNSAINISSTAESGISWRYYAAVHNEADGAVEINGGKISLSALKGDGINSTRGTTTLNSDSVVIDVERDGVYNTSGTTTLNSNSVVIDAERDGIYNLSGTTTLNSNGVVIDAVSDGVYNTSGIVSLNTKGNNTISASGSNSGSGIRANGKGTINVIAQNNTVKFFREQEDSSNAGIRTGNHGSVLLEADNTNNILANSTEELTVSDDNTYGDKYAINASTNGTVDMKAGSFNTVYGAVYATGDEKNGVGSVTIGKLGTEGSTFSRSAGGDVVNYIGSAAIIAKAGGLTGKETTTDGETGETVTTGMDVVSALYAEKGAQINLSGIANTIRTYYADPTDKHTSERVVWAYDGANIAIDGETHISTYNYDESPNSGDIAIAAGTATDLEDKDFTDEALNNLEKATVNLNYKAGSSIEGDILAAYGGEVNISNAAMKTKAAGEEASVDGIKIHGNLLAGNTGVLNVNLGNGGQLEGRADDYGDAGTVANNDHGTTFFDPAFSSEILTGGAVNLTMGEGSYWKVTGQSWVTKVDTGNSEHVEIDLVSANSNLNEKAQALTIGEMSGNAMFTMQLDGNRKVSDMLYMKKANGEYFINLENPVTVEDMYNGFDGLRFATVGKGSHATFSAGTYDNGVYNVEYEVGTDDYNGNKENNAYNSTDNDGKMDAAKPGNDLVDNLFKEDEPQGAAAKGVMTLAAVASPDATEDMGTNTGMNGADLDDTTNFKLIGVKSTELSDAGKTVVAMSKVNYANAIYMDRLNKRMGEARYIDGDEGLWVRIRHDRIGKSDAFRSKNTMMELGYDKRVDDREDGEHRQGFAIDYMRGTTDYDNVAGDGDVRRGGLWLYDTWLGDKGHYSDYVLKIGRLSNDFEIYARSTGEKITGDYSNFVYSASAEYGRKKDIGGSWYIEPQAQIQYAHVTDADYTTSQDTHVQLDAIDSLIGRAGFRLGKDVSDKSTFYIKADVLHEFLGDQDIDAYDATGRLDTTYENEGTWYDVGLGFSHQFSKGTYMFLDVEKTFGNDNEDTYQFNFGMNWKV